jgi:hypothetical protein
MREYRVKAGDTPALIAARYAGCPKCAIDLVAANPHKPAGIMPNGFKTFKSLTVDEKIALPDKWFDGTLDKLPPSYFAALPYADGTTRGTLGDIYGTLGASYSAALMSAAQGALAAINADPNHCASVAVPGTPVNSAVHAFKVAWNASQTPPVPINTGKYEGPTAIALAKVLGAAPTACDGVVPVPTAAPVPAKAPLSTGSVVGIGLLVAGAVGGAAYLATHHKPTRRKVRRVYRHARRRLGR